MDRLNEFEYFVFDKDGTLLNSIEKYVKIFVDVLKESYENVDVEKVRTFFLESSGRPLDWQFKKCLELCTDEKDLSDKVILELEKKFWLQDKKEELFFFEGACELIEKLSKRGKKIFLTTGGLDTQTLRQLENAKILDFFEVVLGSEKIGKSKKHIERFAQSQSLSLEDFARKACYFGDTFLDISIAKECGIFMVSVATTFSKEILEDKKPDLIVDSILEVESNF